MQPSNILLCSLSSILEDFGDYVRVHIFRFADDYIRKFLRT